MCNMGYPITPTEVCKKDVLGIVVTYHPDSKLPERLRVIAEQVGSILVVDNHSNEDAIAMLRDAVHLVGGDLIVNDQNLGVARALNIGIDHAISGGYSWGLLFDQDTVPGPHLLTGLQRAYDGFPTREKVAVIGANYIDAATLRPRRKAPSGRDTTWIERRTVITSGSLVSLGRYQMLGPFRDEYFIDGVDLEYCLRARAEGLKVIMTCEPLMTHEVGQTVLRRLLWKTTGTSNHSRSRRYYMMRNQVDLAKRYLFKEPVWVVASLWTTLKSLILICLFEDGRFQKLKYTAVGLSDGLMSRFDRRIA